LKLSTVVIRFLATSLLALPLVAQPQIGGGTCSSASLNGTYALSLTARQVNVSGTFLSVIQANGSATFDGLSSVTIAATEDTNQAVGTALNWSGTYSVEANCSAVVTISTGGSATLNVMIYNLGKDFVLAGNDATNSYSGNGVTQSSTPPTGCSNSTLSGVYTFNATGFTLAANAVSGVTDGTGLLQFDGQGNLTANVSTTASGSSSSSTTALTGTYTLGSNCTGSATLTDSGSHSFVMSFSVYSITATNTNFYASLARSGNFIITGGGHTAYAQAAAETCTTSSLNGTYSLVLSGRGISGTGNFTGSYQGIGTATFDGQGNVTLAGTVNTNLAQGKVFSYAGTYTLASNCTGTLTAPITLGQTNGTALFTLVVWSNGGQFDLAGSDSTYVYSASGNNSQPPACATPTLSGEYGFTASGFTEAGTTQNGSQDEAGVLQFDGQGNVTAIYTDTAGGTSPAAVNTTGTYTVGTGCTASATLANSNTLNFVIGGLHGETLDLLAANSQFVRTGTAHSAFTNPSQAIGNVASYAYSATPAGSVFALFGVNLATRDLQATTVPLPGTLLTTSVTVNGEPAPLFYVSAGQIDAQMPWDIQGNSVASVIVTNGTASNAAAVYVPATGTPGISVYGNDRAVVVNADGNVNSGGDQASVGDEVVVYFTGGGPVSTSGTLKSGSPAPAGLSPVTGDNSITVGGVSATVKYMGLTPGSIGLYQANFIVPQLAKGAYPVVITIAGNASNNPVINVSN
jgi:uncharacterized protein (TIGR03437 family)